MKETLEKVIKNNTRGLFLLDPPTGFGKTTAVVKLMRRFLKGDDVFSSVKKVFFVTTLLNNLPYDDLMSELTEEEKNQCFRAKAISEPVIDNIGRVEIFDKEITSCEEYKRLKKDVDAYQDLFEQCKTNFKLISAKEILKQKISSETEPAFRSFIKDKYFFNKSIVERRKFIADNSWFKLLYPICEIEKYKVIFMSTKRFILPIDTFKRMPFYIYEDDITKDSIMFIDEFDSTKSTMLDQIIEEGLKTPIDIVELFLSLHYSLQNTVLPSKLLKSTDYNKNKVANDGWHSVEEHFSFWRGAFKKTYDENNLQFLLKSFGFEYNRAFLFDDGKYFNVIKDSSKKFIYASLNRTDNYLMLQQSEYNDNKKMINSILRQLQGCIDGFCQAIFYIYNDYMYYKNDGLSKVATKYSDEEALFTVLDVLNLSVEQKNYLFKRIRSGDYLKNKVESDVTMRKGFNFTEIEDSNYHDMKSISRNFVFSTTPEDILLKLALNSLIIGISATSKIDTCIGNFDLNYLCKKLGKNFITIAENDAIRIGSDFSQMTNKLKGKFQIHANIIDNFEVFTDRDKAEKLINILFTSKELKQKYIQKLTELTNVYYYLNELKIVYTYNEVARNHIQSFIAFANSFPKTGGLFDYDRLMEMINDIIVQNNLQEINFEIVKSNDFVEKFARIKEKLAGNQPVYVLTTYQTIGSGKNIQYPIPLNEYSRIIVDSDDNRDTKDFEGILLITPTYLIRHISFESEDIYANLAGFLFDQEYLYKNKCITYGQMKINIINGFRRAFFHEDVNFYTKNKDINKHSLKIAIQAIGRICRCRNKNKNIYIYSDKVLVERVQKACKDKMPELLNEEFKSLLAINIAKTDINIVSKYSDQSKQNYVDISNMAKYIRNSTDNIYRWKDLRDFVLKNPTTDCPGEYEKYYFYFNNKIDGYSYLQDSKYNIIDLRIDSRTDMLQVSEQACDLPLIMSFGSIRDFFKQNNYAIKFNKANYILCPSTFKQVYLGALGEIVGKFLIERELGYDLKEIEDKNNYEYFDYQCYNLYFDFKHWDNFIQDNDNYVNKVLRKLDRVKGEKCVVVNLLKRTEALPKINNNGNVFQLPYLLDIENSVINSNGIEKLHEFLID